MSKIIYDVNHIVGVENECEKFRRRQPARVKKYQNQADRPSSAAELTDEMLCSVRETDIPETADFTD